VSSLVAGRMPPSLAVTRFGPRSQCEQFQLLGGTVQAARALAWIVLPTEGVETFWIVSEERQRARSFLGDGVLGIPG